MQNQLNPMMQLMQLLAGENPRMQQMLEMMQAQGTAETSEAVVITPPDDVVAENRKLAGLLRRSRQEMKRLDAEVQDLQDHFSGLIGLTDELAAALGACPNCWGRSPGCTFCLGRGGPGAYPPDQNAFDHCVLPLFRRSAWARQKVDNQLKPDN